MVTRCKKVRKELQSLQNFSGMEGLHKGVTEKEKERWEMGSGPVVVKNGQDDRHQQVTRTDERTRRGRRCLSGIRRSRQEDLLCDMIQKGEETWQFPETFRNYIWGFKRVPDVQGTPSTGRTPDGDCTVEDDEWGNEQVCMWDRRPEKSLYGSYVD